MTNWIIVHECDNEDGTPTQWCTIINKPEYGKYCWVSNIRCGYVVEVNVDGFRQLVTCKSLTSAKRWVSMNLM